MGLFLRIKGPTYYMCNNIYVGKFREKGISYHYNLHKI